MTATQHVIWSFVFLPIFLDAFLMIELDHPRDYPDRIGIVRIKCANLCSGRLKVFGIKYAPCIVDRYEGRIVKKKH